MSRQHKCPRCHSLIPDTHIFGHAIICSQCGWSASAAREYFIDEQKNSTINAMWMTTFAIVVAFAVIGNWGASSIDIVPLKMYQWTGQASHKDLLKLTEICKQRKRISCVKEALLDIADRFPKEANQELLELGIIQGQQEDYQGAIKSLEMYLGKNSKDMEAHYQLAIAYGKMGELKKASAHYRQIIKHKTPNLEFMAVRSYVDLLIENNLLDRAEKIIVFYRHKTGHPQLMLKQSKAIHKVRETKIVAKRK
ncbi:MAG: tetratricopeptide repeat protein [Bdellovibrionales bacterium]|nr:tetratricopeptide repeat protein [Bdellovibrionales bacterium]